MQGTQCFDDADQARARRTPFTDGGIVTRAVSLGHGATEERGFLEAYAMIILKKLGSAEILCYKPPPGAQN